VAFLVLLIALNRRMGRIERAGIEVNSLQINRGEKAVYLNDFAFKLTDAAIETLSVLAEARMDDENQMMSELLVKNIARKGYMLAIDKDVIRMT